MKVMIVVTHLLGTGHLARALTLARAFAKAGDTPCVVSGGAPVPLFSHTGMRFEQLPPVRSDGVDFSRLLSPSGALMTEEDMNIRKRMLLGIYADFSPDLLITELFPFGRRILRDEFQALLALAKTSTTPPLICASIRDILAPPSKPKKAVFADDMVAHFYDAVLVHSDADLTPLDLSWPVTPTLSPKLQYTGFVAPKAAAPHPNAAGKGEVIVSAGGGDVGTPVYEAAVAAAAQIEHPMRILVGGAAPQARIAALLAGAPINVVIEPARKDFRQMLTHAAASVSLCGYNTALDILQAGTPAVFIPFDEGNEVEQGIRAQALAQKENIVNLQRADLTAETLSAAITAVIAAPHRNDRQPNFDGAEETVRMAHRLRAQQ
ncbi:MAG: glycosyltransferase [Sulfitobacter sp.]